MELLWASIEGNVDTMLHAMRYDIAVERVEAPTAALEYARRLAQHGVPVNALVRAYRLGQRRMTELIFAELRATDIPDAMRVAVIEAMGTAIFAYIDWMSQQVVVIYEDERERWLENQNTLRGVRVREILAATKSIRRRCGDHLDPLSAALAPRRAGHVVPGPGRRVDELPRLQKFLRELGEAAGVDASPLFVAADRSSGWGWLPYRASADDAVATIRRFAQTDKDSPSVAIGTLAAGVEGFRYSHRQAAEARDVAIVTEQPNSSTPTVLAASDPGLSVVARLGGDVAGTREWVAGVLGDLAADTENDARLRDTLRVYLGCGASYKVAAEELNMHFNSVKYRVGRAVARRGREIGNDRLDVELALLACHWYGARSCERNDRARDFGRARSGSVVVRIRLRRGPPDDGEPAAAVGSRTVRAAAGRPAPGHGQRRRAWHADRDEQREEDEADHCGEGEVAWSHHDVASPHFLR